MIDGQGWRVFRDPAGVPHVQAENLTALAHGHGYVTGLDRAWHVEVLRHRAETRSAELLGPEAFDADALSLAADVVGTARQWWRAASAADQEFFAAYARGMSAALAEGWAQSPEVREAGLAEHPVRPWDPWTPVAVHLDAHLLTGSLPEQLWRRRVREVLGADWVSLLDAESPSSAGSNAWLVPGELSVSGSPLLAADPHRIVEESGPYQPVCLSAPGLRVRGLALVGLPGVPHFGRTESAAWAVTAAMTVSETLTDVAVEAQGGTWHVVGSGETLVPRQAVLRSRDGVERSITVRSCAAGFVLPGTEAQEALLSDPADGAVAVVTAVAPASPAEPSRALAACRELLGARTADEVVAAHSGWAVPCNDVLAADDQGACRHTVVGAFLGAAQEPRETTGITVRANQRPDDPQHSAARLACASPHRAHRATALIDDAVAAHGRVRHEDLLAAQLDTAAPHWPRLLRPLFTAPAGGAGGTGPSEDGGSARKVSHTASWVRARLLSWSGQMAANSTGASWFAVWRDAFVQELMERTPLSALAGPTGMPSVWDPFLQGTARVGLALENVIRCGPALGVDARDAALSAVERVASEHLGTTGQVMPAWGDLHAFAPHRADPAATPASPVPVGGDTDCLLSAGTLPGVGPACLRVPAARVLWDLADPAASWWITPDPVDRGRRGEAPVHRWSRGEVDQALPWVPAGALGPTGTALDLGTLPPDAEGTAGGSRLVLRPVDPAHDAATIHEWVTAPRARFWGMAGASREDVAGIYGYLAESPTHHAWIVEVDGEPSGIFQTYEPHADPVGAVYRVEPGDLGIHVLLASSRSRPATAELGQAVLEQVLRHGRTRRIVGEPDVSNERALARLQATGFELGPAVELPGKTGRLAFLRLPAAHGSGQS